MKRYTYKELLKEFHRLINKGDIWLIHSSLKSMGYIEGGAETVVNVLKECAGEEGTLCMPTFSYSFTDKPPYDRYNSPSEVGIITEIFRKSKGMKRSNHPTHSISAWGKYAEYITSDWDDWEPYSFKGSFGKLYELGAKIMMVGCGLYPNSTLHAVEDWINIPYLCPSKAHRYTKDGRIEILEFNKMPLGHRSFYYDSKSEIPEYAIPLLKKQIIKETRIEEARTYIMNMRELVDETVENIRREKDILLCDRKDCSFCVEAKGKLIRWEVKRW